MRAVKIPEKNVRVSLKEHSKHRYWTVIIPVALIFNFLRPLPPAKVVIYPISNQANGKIANLKWPNESSQAALGAEGFGLLETHGEQSPIATASIAKVITALCVLQKHPLKIGEAGPLITISEVDYDFYQNQVVNGGSLAPVYIGQKIDEYSALQALMLPSANNMADTLAVWAFGNMESYHKFAKQYVASLGMNQTVIESDASGYDPGTKSTAADLVRLGLAAAKNPVLMEIASQKTFYWPGAGVLNNYNRLLGENGIDGLKTGNNSENLGGLLFTQQIKAENQSLRVIGVVMGAPNLSTALNESSELAATTQPKFVSYMTAKTPAGYAQTKWGSRAILAEQPIGKIVYYQNQPLSRQSQTKSTTSTNRDEQIGTFTYKSGNQEKVTKIIVKEPATAPSFWWRLMRIR